MHQFVYVAIGAALGANARYWVGMWMASRFGIGFPYGTLTVNISGSLLLGFLLTLATGRLPVSPELRLLLGVGFLGSYTTFSSYTVETVMLAQNGALWLSLLNILGNNIASLAAAIAGVFLARLVG